MQHFTSRRHVIGMSSSLSMPLHAMCGKVPLGCPSMWVVIRGRVGGFLQGFFVPTHSFQLLDQNMTQDALSGLVPSRRVTSSENNQKSWTHGVLLALPDVAYLGILVHHVKVLCKGILRTKCHAIISLGV